jgi:hypothetical protein
VVCAPWKPTEGFKFPSQIARKYKINPKSVTPPTRLGSRAINKVATTELVRILKHSSLFDKLQKAAYYDDSDLFIKIGTNKRVIRDATTELVRILKHSSMFDKLQKVVYYDDSDLFIKIGTNKRVIRDGLEKEDDYEYENSDDESAMEEESTHQNIETTTEKPLPWALKEGTIPDHKYYPILHKYGIPIDNTHRRLTYYYWSYKRVKNECNEF